MERPFWDLVSQTPAQGVGVDPCLLNYSGHYKCWLLCCCCCCCHGRCGCILAASAASPEGGSACINLRHEDPTERCYTREQCYQKSSLKMIERALRPQTCEESETDRRVITKSGLFARRISGSGKRRQVSEKKMHKFALAPSGHLNLPHRFQIALDVARWARVREHLSRFVTSDHL